MAGYQAANQPITTQHFDKANNITFERVYDVEPFPVPVLRHVLLLQPGVVEDCRTYNKGFSVLDNDDDVYNIYI